MRASLLVKLMVCLCLIEHVTYIHTMKIIVKRLIEKYCWKVVNMGIVVVYNVNFQSIFTMARVDNIRMTTTIASVVIEKYWWKVPPEAAGSCCQVVAGPSIL